MSPNLGLLAKSVSYETGLAFQENSGIDAENQRWFELKPHGVLKNHGFTIRIVLGWRRLHIDFHPEKFAGDLVSGMARADNAGRLAFREILTHCEEKGAEIDLRINGNSQCFKSHKPWGLDWKRFALRLSKGQLELGTEEGEPDTDIVCRWAGRFAAAIVAILPLEEESVPFDSHIYGYPEGALTITKVNRFERDHRNRAAAIAIHGTSCAACRIDMGAVYGTLAEGLVEIHHITPVSQLGEGYVVNPEKDLVPLCPNCHAVAHCQSPPLTVEEIRYLLQESRSGFATSISKL